MYSVVVDIKVISSDYLYVEFSFKGIEGEIISEREIAFDVLIGSSRQLSKWRLSEEAEVDLTDVVSLHELSQGFGVPVKMQVTDTGIQYTVSILIEEFLGSLELAELSQCLFSRSPEVRQLAANLLRGDKSE